MSLNLQVKSANYFLHHSFLNEIADTWLTKSTICPAGDLLMKLLFTSGVKSHVMTCDRTMKKITSSSKKSIGIESIIRDCISEESLSDYEERVDSDDEHYAFQIAPIRGNTSFPTFVVVSDKEKARIIKFSKDNNYQSLLIVSTSDFNLNSSKK